MTTALSPRLAYNIAKKGQLNVPGSSAISKKTAEELLVQDVEDHHCFFRSTGFHNHLSHHILAAYDLGAPAGLLKKIYEDEAKIQRPIFLDEKDKNIVVDRDNWVQYLRNQSAYGAFVQFFSREIADFGVGKTLENFVFNEEANVAGADMMSRTLGGVLHPLIQIGYGAEFGIETLIATGLAQACTSGVIPGTVFKIDKSPPEKSISLLELLRRVYDSAALKPAAYNPDTLIVERIRKALANGGKEELEKFCALYHISDSITDAELDKKVEEITFVSTLLLSGTGRMGRKPRLDFFLMHLVTSSLFLRPLSMSLRKSEHKAALLRAFVPVMMTVVLSRGRPRINAELAMSYTATPRAPKLLQPGEPTTKPSKTAVGNPLNDEDFNPWPGLIEGCLYHADSHVLKTIRTLYLGAQQCGDVPLGKLPGALWKNEKGEAEETHVGIAKVDGTVFVRAAGVVMDTLGWSGHGQKEGEWDRSALGWDAAWESGD